MRHNCGPTNKRKTTKIEWSVWKWWGSYRNQWKASKAIYWSFPQLYHFYVSAKCVWKWKRLAKPPLTINWKMGSVLSKCDKNKVEDYSSALEEYGCILSVLTLEGRAYLCLLFSRTGESSSTYSSFITVFKIKIQINEIMHFKLRQQSKGIVLWSKRPTNPQNPIQLQTHVLLIVTPFVPLKMIHFSF